MKKVLKLFLCLFLLVAALAGGYVVYCSSVYYRIEDDLEIEIENNQAKSLEINQEYSILTYNIGFGAYSQDYDFFMDEGVMLDGTIVKGTKGKAYNKEETQKNTNGSIDLMKANVSDFYLLQEVDENSDRSYHVNQVEAIKEAFSTYGSAFAMNFHSPYLILPIYDMHGKSISGLLTLSRYEITKNIRRQYIVSDAFFTKFTDLDRCFDISRLQVSNGKELVIINSHMSAYDKGGTIREQQVAQLREIMIEEYAKGNYLIIGGDFNHDLFDSIGKFAGQQATPTWVATLTQKDLVDGMHIVTPINSDTISTCRSAEIPYEKGINYEVSVDGFIVSDNIEAISVIIDNEYLYSDHNPVRMTFVLK